MANNPYRLLPVNLKSTGGMWKQPVKFKVCLRVEVNRILWKLERIIYNICLKWSDCYFPRFENLNWYCRALLVHWSIQTILSYRFSYLGFLLLPYHQAPWLSESKFVLSAISSHEGACENLRCCSSCGCIAKLSSKAFISLAPLTHLMTVEQEWISRDFSIFAAILNQLWFELFFVDDGNIW